LAVVLALAFTSGCAAETPDEGPEAPGTEDPQPPTSAPALAVGVHDSGDGTVQVVGFLEYVELEGGIWRIVDASASDEAETLAVLGNAAEMEDELAELEGAPVAADGRWLDGTSIRMAGPELDVDDIAEISDVAVTP
jgi:hypothetical protein